MFKASICRGLAGADMHGELFSANHCHHTHSLAETSLTGLAAFCLVWCTPFTTHYRHRGEVSIMSAKQLSIAICTITYSANLPPDQPTPSKTVIPYEHTEPFVLLLKTTIKKGSLKNCTISIKGQIPSET